MAAPTLPETLRKPPACGHSSNTCENVAGNDPNERETYNSG